LILGNCSRFTVEKDRRQRITLGLSFEDLQVWKGRPMGEYHTIVRLTDKGAAVRLGQVDFTVSPRDGAGVGRGCPIEYMATALGS
jgi:hypothetical protein